MTLQCQLLGFVAGLGIATTLSFVTVAQAQIVPDNTLGTESSVVDSQSIVHERPADLIRGGAQREGNLFHSFSQFDVGEEQRVYFANPEFVSSIFSRITGDTPSNILGLLGVDGSADLFLINPNGIIFGEAATLDINGSFYGTTAAVAQGDNSNGADSFLHDYLLTVKPEILFSNYLSDRSGNIVSTAQLSTGEDLVLAGRNLNIQGQLLAAENLLLLAQDIVTIRDTAMDAFIGRSGKNLTIQGASGIDILALNHPNQTPFSSGGDLVLRSDGVISGDARFASGGRFLVESVSGELANFVSLNDPIISATDGVDFASDYTGTSLLIESQGNVTVQGDITITTPDIVSNFIGDDSILSLRPGLIIRSGQESLIYGGSDLVPLTELVPEGITLLGGVITPGGPVRLTARTGNITVQSISTVEAAGGDIVLTAAGDIDTDALSSSSIAAFGDAADGGSIMLVSDTGSITNNGSLLSISLSVSGRAGNGGSISISSTSGDIVNNALVESSSVSILGSAGDGGDITVVSDTGNIINNDVVASTSASSLQDAGNGGNIRMLSTSGNIINTAVSSGAVAANGNTGSGGSVTMASATGDILNPLIDASSFSTQGNVGDGGEVFISSTAGNITNVEIDTSSTSSGGRAGAGGNVTISSASGDIDNSFSIDAKSASTAQDAADGGSITVRSQSGNINNALLDTSSGSTAGNTGNGGAIAVSSTSGDITNGLLISLAAADQGNAGRGGAITITSTSGDITNNLLFSLSSSLRGNTDNGGAITITSESGDIINNNSFLSPGDSSLFSGSTAIEGDSGDGGAIAISSASGQIINRSPLIASSISAFGDAGDGGDISISSVAGNIVNEEPLFASSNSVLEGDAGRGGNISVTAGSGDIANTTSVFDSAWSSSSSAGNGNAGDSGAVAIASDTGSVLVATDVVAASVSEFGRAGNGGAISIAANQGSITGDSNQLVTVAISEAGAVTGSGGAVDLMAREAISEIAILTVSSAGESGDVAIQGLGDLRLEDIQLITTGQFEIPDPSNLDNVITINLDELGQSGDVAIASLGDLILNTVVLQSDANGATAAGNITVLNAGDVELNNSEILSDTNASGQGGSIRFANLNSLTLNNSTLSTDTAGQGGGAGNILIEDVGILFLSNGSLLLGDAANASDGGDIAIATNFVIALPDENSDIIVNAVEGRGGVIDIAATGIYGLTPQSAATTAELRANQSSDISASSQFGQPGVVAISAIDVDPSNELDDLTTDFINPDSLIASSCIRSRQNGDSSLTVIGSENLPQQPGNSTGSIYSTTAVQTIPIGSTSQTIDEPEAIYQLADGRLILSHPCHR